MSGEVMANLANLRDAVDAILAKFDEINFASRYWKKDPSLWHSDAPAMDKIANRLGWLELPRTMLSQVADLTACANEITGENFTHLVLVGMGGSTLGAEVLRQILGKTEGYPELITVDTTDADFIAEVRRRIDPATTLFIVSSKSGLTLELNSLLAYFWQEVSAVKETAEAVGENFIAITNPGTQLERYARDHKFREVFLAPVDIGGRYSALSNFGIVPAALCGYDVRELLSRAATMSEECHKRGADNPGLHLGTILGAAVEAGRDKLTLILPPSLQALGLLVEQLVAASTGKDGRGIVPIIGEELAAPELYGSDRLFVAMYLPGQKDPQVEEKLKKLEEAGHPVIRLKLLDRLEILAEFFRWEFAVPVAAAILEVNPFDEPEVAASKTGLKERIAEYEQTQSLIPPDMLGWDALTLRVTPDAAEEATDTISRLELLWQQVQPGDYVGLLAYLTPQPETDAQLQEIRQLIRAKLKVATTANYGPRLLYSTGQLHKSGPNKGVFIVLAGGNTANIAVPGAQHDFLALKLAQAFGDYESLQAHERRAVLIYTSNKNLPNLFSAIQDSLNNL